MVPSSVWFFRFSNDKIFEYPAGEKNSQTYLTDFIKEIQILIKGSPGLQKSLMKHGKVQKKLSNKQNLRKKSTKVGKNSNLTTKMSKKGDLNNLKVINHNFSTKLVLD